MGPIDAIIEAFQTLLSWIGSFFVEIGKALTNVFQWFYDTLLKPTFDFIGGLINGIIDLLSDIVSFIGDFFVTLWNFIVDIFKFLFVPGDNFFGEKVEGLSSNISSKVGVDISTLESLKGVAQRSTRAPIIFKFDFEVMGHQVLIDLDFIKQVQPYSQGLFMGLSSIFLCWYNYKNVMRLFGKSTVEGSGKGSNEK